MRRYCSMESRIILLVSAMVVSQGWALCYFPAEFQGEFLTQSSSRTGAQSGMHVQYASVTVLAESIPVWGVCHKRIGKSVLLMDRTGGTNCVRCFQLTLRSPNVLQIHTEGLDKCYTTEEAALATCPTPDSIANRQSREIMLYKNKESTGEVAIAQEYCPINGRFRFTYSLNDGLENSMECQEPASELSNCPYGFGLHVRFRRCSFGDMDINFQCLGDWAGRNGERYMALLDMQDSALPGAELRPKYRCAVYKEEAGSGKIQLALSSDSTCQSDLKTATAGYETLVLTTVPSPKWPPLVDASSCRFPDWAQGHWQNTYIHNDMMVYKDHRNFRTYTARCVEQPGSNGKLIIYARTQCGDELYTCMWLQRRADNVIEFQLGMQAALNYNHSLCQHERFEDQAWITQGIAIGQEVYQEEACPISGEYTGVIPDAMGLCAKLHSDCRNPQIMLFTISNCYNTSEIYEAKIPTFDPRRRGKRKRRSDMSFLDQPNPEDAYDPWSFHHSTATTIQTDGFNPFDPTEPSFQHDWLTQSYTDMWKWRWESSQTPTVTTITTTDPIPTSPFTLRSLRDPVEATEPKWRWQTSTNRIDIPSSPKPTSVPIEIRNPFFSSVPTRLLATFTRPYQPAPTPRTVSSPPAVVPRRSRPPVKRRIYRAGEEREYRCLGQWTENGLTYTFTQRRDVIGYECFAGVIVTDGELVIKEAGENCLRDVEPMKMGMKLTRQASCYSPRQPAPGSNIPLNNRPADNGRFSTSQPFDHPTTKPWKPITGDPRERVGSHSTWNTPSSLAIMLPLLALSRVW